MATAMSTHSPAHYQEKAHYKEATIYQIYPASFCDSNGDGIGDIPGIISKLDYLKDLGVDVIWLSPVYKSPFIDNGYDVSDYCDINPQFGTLEDMDELIAGMHKRDMKLVMDLIINHSSDQHEWFKKSRAAKENNPFRDYYRWLPAKYDSDGNRVEPNNWREEFSNGSAWEWDEKTQEYYLHLYCKEMPDLNWENPKLRQAVYNDIIKWWLDRGVDGFRMDVINLISKAPGYPDASIQEPEDKYQWSFEHTANGPRIHEYLQEMNREVLSKYPGIVTVGETPFCGHDFDILVPYVLPENKELQMVFQFEQQEVDGYPQLVPRDWRLSEFKAITSRWQVGMQERGGWNSIYLENHDEARSVSRFGNDKTDESRTLSAKMLAILQCTLSGTIYIYQGEEIGMKNVPESWPIEEYKDVMSQVWYKEREVARAAKSQKPDPDMTDILSDLQRKARDNARTPVQWDDSDYAGFSPAGSSAPWMKVNEDYKTWNVASQLHDKGSVFSFWREMLGFRKKHLSCIYGLFTPLDADHEEVYSYLKTYKHQECLVLLNFTDKTVQYSIPRSFNSNVEDHIGNYELSHEAMERLRGGSVSLRPYEGMAVLYAQGG